MEHTIWRLSLSLPLSLSLSLFLSRPPSTVPSRPSFLTNQIKIPFYCCHVATVAIFIENISLIISQHQKVEHAFPQYWLHRKQAGVCTPLRTLSNSCIRINKFSPLLINRKKTVIEDYWYYCYNDVYVHFALSTLLLCGSC